MEGLMRKLLLLLLVSALAHGATPLTGKWSGSFDIMNSDGERKADTAYMDLSEQDERSAAQRVPTLRSNGRYGRERSLARN
jgi:hypothetical protein